MKKYIFIYLFSVVLVSCKEIKKESDTTSVENNTVEKKTRYPSIKVGKGPDALFLTPD